MWTRIAGHVLVLAAIFQVAVLFARGSAWPQAGAMPIFMAHGDTVNSLQVRFDDGRSGQYRPGGGGRRWTVLLAFRSDCAPSHVVAPEWSRWLSAARPVDVLAVTRDSLAAALAYRERQRWPVRLVSVQGARRGSAEHSLITRTPWIFLLDPAGVVRYQGHGSTLALLDSIITREVVARSPSAATVGALR